MQALAQVIVGHMGGPMRHTELSKRYQVHPSALHWFALLSAALVPSLSQTILWGIESIEND